MTTVRITVADVEVELDVSGGKVADLVQLARAELDHALDRAADGRLEPKPHTPIGFHTELAPNVEFDADVSAGHST